MIFGLGDDVTLSVYDDIEHVRRACSAVDVRNGFYRFFDDRGRSLAPVFRAPPVARRNLFRPTSTPQNMEAFDLVPLRDGSRPDLQTCLSQEIVLNTAPRFSAVEEIRAYLAAPTSNAP